ncbi:hypothetical protein B4121_0698 [Bacillus paralicheniformis]|uniref:Uncharacterized protein n=1 Tax=Bacillus paralicheniformis TaxID=1648923 RepID=A0A7Z0X141_9BACI|nr:hypothetical protein B4121_0698 [Bacillus paralicheniformis]
MVYLYAKKEKSEEKKKQSFNGLLQLVDKATKSGLIDKLFLLKCE